MSAAPARYIVVVSGRRDHRRYVVIDTTCNRRSWWGDPVKAYAEAAALNTGAPA